MSTNKTRAAANAKGRWTMSKLIGLLAGVLIATAPAVARAQSGVPEPQRARDAHTGTATSFSELAKLLEPGAVIRVTDASGRRTTGRLGQLSASSLELLGTRGAGTGGSGTGQARIFPEADVRSIEVRRRDSLVNGTLIGLVAGGVGGAVGGAAVCGSYSCNAARVAAASGALFGGIGAGVGVLTDLAITGRTRVYASGQRSPDVRVAPVLSKGGAGAIVSLRF